MKIWTQSQRQLFFFFLNNSRLYDLPEIFLNIESVFCPSRGSLVNSKYNRKIRDVIYQAIFVRTSVLAKYTCVCALHTLTDGLSTVPASAAPAFTPLVRQEELRQLCKAGRTRKEEERLKKPLPVFRGEGYP